MEERCLNDGDAANLPLRIPKLSYFALWPRVTERPWPPCINFTAG
jgi:hypothetical protein